MCEGANVLLLAALGPMLAMWWSCRVSVESRKAKVQSPSKFGSLWLRSLVSKTRASRIGVGGKNVDASAKNNIEDASASQVH